MKRLKSWRWIDGFGCQGHTMWEADYKYKTLEFGHQCVLGESKAKREYYLLFFLKMLKR